MPMSIYFPPKHNSDKHSTCVLMPVRSLRTPKHRFPLGTAIFGILNQKSIAEKVSDPFAFTRKFERNGYLSEMGQLKTLEFLWVDVEKKFLKPSMHFHYVAIISP